MVKVEEVLDELLVEDFLDENIGKILHSVIEQRGNLHIGLPAVMFVALNQILKFSMSGHRIMNAAVRLDDQKPLIIGC